MVTIDPLRRGLKVSVQGRLDAFASGELQKALEAALRPDTLCVVLDLSGVFYLSSAGLRVLLAAYKKIQPGGGRILLAGLRDYCRNVIETAGFAETFPQHATLDQALTAADRLTREQTSRERWDKLETTETPAGIFRILPGDSAPAAVEVLGDVRAVLHAGVRRDQVCSKRFCETEYSIGLGGLGNFIEDYFTLMGEMMTVGGTMVWLPTDGHDTPDFLIPKKDTGQVTLRTAFNVTLAGGFNELMVFDSRDPVGITVDALYRLIFDLARRRRTDYRGIVGLGLCARMSEVYGSGVKKAPVEDFAPAGDRMITDPAVIDAWFEFDRAPRHRDVTALVVGVGADLTMDLKHYDAEQLNRVFYLNPANVGSKTALLHNHAVMFQPQPVNERPVDLDDEVRRVIENGEFVDMRHLLDGSKLTHAFLGVSYAQAVRSDPHGQQGA